MIIDSPYIQLNGTTQLRGNLHAHTNRSDGRRVPQAVIDDYAQRGYDFLMFSDHDLFTSAADYTAWNAQGMVLIPGNEITRNGPHMLHVNGTQLIEPSPDRQAAIDAVRASQGFVVVNHPNWQDRFDHCPMEMLHTWQGYAGIEIYNGVISRLDGSPYATNKWDQLLSQGRRVWGFANDDSHWEVGEVGLGWNVVFVRERSPAAIVDALANGRFYASTGVVIKTINQTGNRIRVETENADRVVALMQVGKRIAQADDRTLEVEIPANAKYVRFECWGRGESFAWTQPIFVCKDQAQ